MNAQIYNRRVNSRPVCDESQEKRQDEVAIIDLLRETKPLIDRAIADKDQIKYVFETHLHTHFMSAPMDLPVKRQRDHHVYGRYTLYRRCKPPGSSYSN